MTNLYVSCYEFKVNEYKNFHCTLTELKKFKGNKISLCNMSLGNLKADIFTELFDILSEKIGIQTLKLNSNALWILSENNHDKLGIFLKFIKNCNIEELILDGNYFYKSPDVVNKIIKEYIENPNLKNLSLKNNDLNLTNFPYNEHLSKPEKTTINKLYYNI